MQEKNGATARAFLGSVLALVALEPARAAVATDASPSAAADGAPAAEETSIGEEIVVTARQRSESAQDVPIALNVVSAEALERRGDYTLLQIQQQVPALQVYSFNPRNTNVNIRGLGSNVALTNDGLENGVGFYVDGVYYGRVGLSQFDLVDLERVEVLRGPQGTLFGKNTTSGVINVVSRAPSFDPELSAEASIGNYGYYQLRASASAPLIADKLAVRLSGAITERNGFLYNVTQRSRAQDYYNASVRGQLLFKPSEVLSIRVIGDFSRQKQNHVLNVFANFVSAYDDGTAIPNNFYVRAARFPGYTPLPVAPFRRLGEADSHYQANMDGYGVSGQVDWTLGSATLTSVTAYRWWDWNPANDGDSTALPITTLAQQANRQRQFSQELRLASNSDGPVNYTAGVYYFWQVIRGYGKVGFGPAAALWNVPTLPAAIGNAALNGYETYSTSNPRTRSYAGFGQVDWKIAEPLTLTAGLRYTHEKKDGRYTNVVTAAPDIAAFTAEQQATVIALRRQFSLAPLDYSQSLTDNSLSGLVTLKWQITPDANIYGSYSRGSKSGGLNLTSLPVDAAGNPTVPISVRPEKVDSFELGFKSQFLDRRLTLNGAAYWIVTRDYQTAITEQIGGTNAFVQYIANIPKVRSRGFESDLSYAPSRNFGFNASMAYVDATFRDYTNAPQALERLDIPGKQNLSGARLPGVPKWTYTIGANVTGDLGDLGGRPLAVYASADYSYRTDFNTSTTNSRYAQVPGFGIANARVGLRTAEGVLDVSVWAKNLFDKNYFQTLGANNTGLITGLIGDPRTFGVTLRTKL